MGYQEIIPHLQKRPEFQAGLTPELDQLSFILRASFNLSTTLALGAVLQGILFLLPITPFYAFLPAILFLISRTLLTVLISLGVLRNPYLAGVIHQKFTALIPDRKGNFPKENEVPTKEKVAVLLLFGRVNHPAGWLAAPQMMKFNNLFEKMHQDLKSIPQEQSGLLGMTQAFVPAENGALDILNISYWRSKENILDYANSEAHRDAMKWWTEAGGYETTGGKVAHIGIAHEIYESGPGAWESVYLGYQPTLLAATSYLRKGDSFEKGTVPEEWISPVLSARRGKLAGSKGRFGTLNISKQTADDHL